MSQNTAASTDVSSHKDALALLINDHREVKKAFSDFEELSSRPSKKKNALADEICTELLKHMTIEEEIFYPAVQESVEGAEDVVKESIVEHAAAKELIKAIQDMQGDEELFDSKVKVLGEQIEHHIEEEENEMFPKVKKSSLDLEALGEKMAKRKEQL